MVMLWKPTTKAAMASTTATPRGASTGSCRPLTDNMLASPVVKSTVGIGGGMLEGGLRVNRTIKSEAEAMPPSAPSATSVRNSGPLSVGYQPPWWSEPRKASACVP